MSAHLSARDLVAWNNRIHGEATPLPPKRKPRRNEESQIQRALIKWWSIAHVAFAVPEHLFLSIPNGGRRDAITGAMLKLEGARKGACDLLLLQKRGKWGALLVELKTETGRLSPEQGYFINDAEFAGYCTAVCHSYDQAVRVITEYLDEK
jgi:hypothetical protein